MHGVCKYGSAVLPMWANIHPVKQSMDLVTIVFFTSTPYQNVLCVFLPECHRSKTWTIQGHRGVPFIGHVAWVKKPGKEDPRCECFIITAHFCDISHGGRYRENW